MTKFRLAELTSERVSRLNDDEIDGEHEIDRIAEIERLAALDPIDYDLARNEAVNRLGIRTATLDHAVAKKRRDLGLQTDDGDAGQGRAVQIDDLLPWHEPVEGDHIATALAVAFKRYVVAPDAVADAIAYGCCTLGPSMNLLCRLD